MMIVPPKTAPYPVPAYLSLDPKTSAKRLLHNCKDADVLKCQMNLHVGIFFDGTNNNMDRDRDGARIVFSGNSDSPQKIRRQLSPADRSHSNVVKLFQAYDNDPEYGNFSYYIPGVGTPFDELGEPTESSEGKAFGKGGQARIIFALLQVVNSIHFALTKKNLLDDKTAGSRAQNYDRIVNEQRSDESGMRDDVAFFSGYLNQLRQAIKARPKPEILSLTLDVFGFSRGAAQAVAFCHFFNDLLESGKFASIPAGINFLGVFDTVASIGISSSVSRTLPVPDWLSNGHLSWARRILDPLPGCVRTGRHFIAAHEQRMNFPVTTLEGPSGFKELYFPGVHSDVGGGYGPGESGKGRGGQTDMLSQIPLVFMYKEALTEGALFNEFDQLSSDAQNDFLISKELSDSWNAYRSALVDGNNDKANVLKQHMKLFYSWRARRLDTLHLTASFLAADKQAQQDLTDSNRMLKADLEVLRRRPMQVPEGGQVQFSREERINVSRWQQIHAAEPLDEWERWSLQWFERPHPLTDQVLQFFDNYVHDSIAGFYLAGEVTEFDRRKKVAEVMKMRPEQMNGFEKKIYQLTTRLKDAQRRKEKGELLSSEEEALVREAEHGTPYPVMTDADTEDMASKLIYTQTTTRREGGGYFLRRSYYPQNGFIFLPKKYIREKELDRAHILKPGSQKYGTEEVYEARWSERVLTEVRMDALAITVKPRPEFA